MPRPYWTGGNLLAAAGVLVLTMVLGILLGAAAATGKGPYANKPTPQAAVATAAPAPPSPTPFTPLTLTGQGSRVTDPFHLPAGTYRVSWTARGNDNMIVDVHRGNQQEHLINEIPPNPSSGEASLTVHGGDYFLSVQAPTLSWSLTFTKVA